MEKKIYYIREIKEIKEAGIARDLAFYNEIKKIKDYRIIFLKTNLCFIEKLKQSFKEIVRLLKTKNSKILLHQSSINIIFPSKLFYFCKFKNILMKIERKNSLIIEMNDLPFEQSIDLEILSKKERKISKKIQEDILSLKNTHYIFASEEMRKYAIKKYKIPLNNTCSCINGSIKLNKQKGNISINKISQIKYVYAGTLNKGRQIEELINIFENTRKECKLILLGINGEWILEKNYKNIIYMGACEEEEALKIVSQCDIGVVPYDDRKFYYNICYPTKNSFYLAAGIPILITPLKESLNQLEIYEVLFIEKLNNWGNMIENISLEKILEKKIKVKKMQNKIYWNILIENILKEKIGENIENE